MANENHDHNGQACLFGWLHSPRKGERGRPPHVWSPENSNKIKLLLALGWSNERIANAVGVTLPTLRKHYFSELKVRALARDALDAERFNQLWAAAEKGNVGAMREVARFIEANDQVLRAARERQGQAPVAEQPEVQPERRALPVGKKQAAADAAANAIASDPDLAPLPSRLI